MRLVNRPDSTAIRKIDYDTKAKVLTVFLEVNPGHSHGEVLQYAGVPRDVYEAFASAASVGRYFNLFIRDKYSFVGEV